MKAHLDRELALELANIILEDWIPNSIVKELNINEREELIYSFAILAVKSSRELHQELSVAWAKPTEFYIQPHY